MRKRIILAVVFGLIVLGALAWRYRITRPDFRLEAGEAAVHEADWKAAERLADRLERSGHPNHAHLLRGEIYYARKQPDLAINECNQIDDQGQIRLRAAVLTGRALLDLEGYAEADRVFSFVVSEDPDNIDGHRGLATIAHEFGQSNRAIAHLEQVIRLDSTDARPHRLMAEVLRNADDTNASIAEYREALRLGRGLSATARDEIRFELAMSLAALAQYGDGLEVLNEIERENPEDVHIVAIRAELLRGVGRRREAKILVEQGLAVSKEGAFYRIRGQVQLDEGNASAAVSDLEEATRLSPYHYQSHFLLARAYATAGRQPQAERADQRAEELRKDHELSIDLTREAQKKPWDAAVRFRLAELAERLGDQNTAAMWRRAAINCQTRNK